jgi:hypothetical protein
MGLEKDILDEAGKQMARYIDSEIINNTLIEMLTKDGWTQTKINPAFTVMGPITFDDWYSQTAEWIHINATGDYKLLKGQWLFKEPKDATMFILRWS